MFRSLVDVSLLLISVLAWVEQVWPQSPYVIFGGTNTVVRTRIDPIVNPGTVSFAFQIVSTNVDIS